MADDKATLGKIVKLLTVQKDLIDKLASVTEELDALSGGRAGIGATLRALETVFDRVWGVRYKGSYVWARVKDVPNLKRLLKTLDATDIECRMVRYLKSDDPFYVRARHSFALFVASINSWAAEPMPIVRPLGCTHEPRCLDDAIHTRLKMHEARA